MTRVGVQTNINLKKILYLTDFSKASEAALPFATAMADNHGSTLIALHVLTPAQDCIDSKLRTALDEADEKIAQVEMQHVDSQMDGTAHQTLIDRGTKIWSSVEQAIKEFDANLIVLGTRGRIGVQKYRLGSVAEEIFRCSPVPVLTIGPAVYGSTGAVQFRRILFATDFGHDSHTAVRYAVSFAQENQGQLILLHVINSPQRREALAVAPSVAETMHELYELVPERPQSRYRSEAVVRYGEPAKQIIETAKRRCADLIVLGVHDHAASLGIATHLERSTAHKVVVQSGCPVLTVRGIDHENWLN